MSAQSDPQVLLPRADIESTVKRLAVKITQDYQDKYPLLICILMPLGSFFGGEYAFIFLAITSGLCQVLDCIDGDIARVKKTYSNFGRYLDHITGIVFWLLLYLFSQEKQDYSAQAYQIAQEKAENAVILHAVI